MCSPPSIIFTAVTNGRKAYCNYSYRYWGHLEVVSPHWKTELLLSHKGQVFITWSSERIFSGIQVIECINTRRQQKHIFICQRRKKKRRKRITIIPLWEWVNVPSSTILVLTCLFWCSYVLCSQSLYVTEEVITKYMKGHIHWTSIDWCLCYIMLIDVHTQTYAHAYAHFARWGVCSAVRHQKENLPWHHPGECRCRAGTGSESQEAWWGRLCHATDRLWESGVKECELHPVAELAGALRLWTCSLHKQASLISLCNQVDEACFEYKCCKWKIIFPLCHYTYSVTKQYILFCFSGLSHFFLAFLFLLVYRDVHCIVLYTFKFDIC